MLQIQQKSDFTKKLEQIIEQLKKKNLRKLLNEKVNTNSLFTPKRASSFTNTQNSRSIIKIRSISKESTFKVIGWRKQKSSFKSSCHYVLKNADVLYNNFGNTINKANVNNTLNNWAIEDSETQRQFMHSMYSLPGHIEKSPENIELLKNVINEALDEAFPNNKYLFGIHSNTKNLHVHILLKCKNEVTNKQIRINNPELEAIHKVIDNVAINSGFEIKEHIVKKDRIKEKEEKAKIKARKEAGEIIKLDKNYKIPSSYYQQAPNWVKMQKSGKFKQLSIDKATTEQLKNIGLDKQNISRFANLYLENKRFATWAINENHWYFGLEKSPEFSARIKTDAIKEIQKEQEHSI